MMGYYGNMMGWGGFGIFASLFYIVLLIDMVLLGIWLWRKISQK